MSPRLSTAWHRLRWEVLAVGRSVRRALRGPGTERDLAVQALKAAGAAILAWAIAGWWWKAPLALMAPWTAVVLVQSTVYRSVRAGFQQVVLIAAGTVIAAGAAGLTGNVMGAMAITLPLTMLLGNYWRFGDQGVYASTTALFVLVYGTYSGIGMLHRLLETLLGAVIGIAVNALILPPMHLRGAYESVCRLPEDAAALLRATADGVTEGYGRTDAQKWSGSARGLRRFLDDLGNARTWSRESHRFNPGSRLRRPLRPLPSSEWESAWGGIVDHLTSIAGLLDDAVGEQPRLTPPPDSVLTDELPELLRAAAEVCEADHAVLDGSRAAGTGGSGAGGPGDGSAPPDRNAALDRAWEAHGRMRAEMAVGDHDTAISVGGLAAATQRLLHDLADARPDVPDQC
ncbi:aromatic acid exporter family protein [Streptomyces sp. LP05-1]|uniref:Aromatic acid exporter family protein n=1 Tax=Streptomyces pyxinae TaxID=2970734 RepID=A0ABT2CH78_9ACTN|nr:aromatic acid exporter family protein [Streptomyces sp. LP05-1]MCS0636773.1 aromatic acid exporter family protein [Streptomyces sp. LP05-1]